MNKIKSIFKAVGMTGWFLKASWKYIVTNNPYSKVEYFKGVIPSWFNFTVSTYKDCRTLK